jgi:hypothetical protein
MSGPEIGPDVVAAVIAFLMDEDEVIEYIGTGDSAAIANALPAEEEATMPKPYLVVSRSGGSGGPGARSWMELDAARVDVRAYGVDPSKAADLARKVKRAMKSMSREVYAGVLLHDSVESGGIAETSEPDTNWPVSFAAYMVTYSEIAVLAPEPAPAVAMAFVQQPTAVAVDAPITPAVTVEVLDTLGARVATDQTTEITLEMSPYGSLELSGTVTRTAVDGLATFDDLSVDGNCTITLTATAGALPPVVSASFAVGNGGND